MNAKRVLALLALLTALVTTAQAETRMLTAMFDSPVRNGLTWDFPYDDAWFTRETTDYYHDLARATLGLAAASFRTASVGLDRQDERVRSYLSQAGFDRFVAAQYDIPPSIDTVATMIASKEIEDDGGPCTLIAVAVGGAGYQDEWLSNFTFGGEDYHKGFMKSALDVVGRLCDYIEAQGIAGRVKLWMGGFSRATAVTNLAGYMLSEQGVCEASDLFVSML